MSIIFKTMKAIKICDTHNDFLTELKADELEEYIINCKSQGVKRICSSFWSTRRVNPKAELFEKSKLLKMVSKDFLLHVEDLCWVKTDEDLEFLIETRPFSCSLTWNGENTLAGGCGSNVGLSKWGRACLDRLLVEKIVVDVAHLNRKSFWQVVNVLKTNILCSHTGFFGVRREERNLTDKQIDFIVKSNGFVGLFFFDRCLKKFDGRKFDAQDIVRSLSYFTDRWGYDNIGIGSDFYGIENYPKGLKTYSDFKNLHSAMKLAGFSDNQIDKIFYQNFEDFLNRQ